MSNCNIVVGRGLSCKDSVSGLKAIYIVNYDDLDYENVAFDATNTDEVETWTPATQLNMYKYELKGANGFETTIESSRDNGTTVFNGALSIQLKKQDVATHKTIKLLAYGRPRIIVRTMTNQFFLMGLEQGADVESGTISTGQAMTDFNGYSLNFVSSETIPSPFIKASTEAELKVVFNTVADGSGDDAVIVA
ncbi:hypothetical protein [uncultured Mediterranean phage uvMED]|nr:hypothetical protein [uncultured Mediterranean phage uvMED]